MAYTLTAESVSPAKRLFELAVSYLREGDVLLLIEVGGQSGYLYYSERRLLGEARREVSKSNICPHRFFLTQSFRLYLIHKLDGRWMMPFPVEHTSLAQT